jgi:hypothetical protein
MVIFLPRDRAPLLDVWTLCHQPRDPPGEALAAFRPWCFARTAACSITIPSLRSGRYPDETASPSQSQRRRRQRVNHPEGTKRNIIDTATTEFASKAFSGARADDIAARTKTSKRMIYYYFNGKEGLYIAVLEAAYRNMPGVEVRRPRPARFWDFTGLIGVSIL